MRTGDTMALLDDDEIRDRLADLDGWEGAGVRGPAQAGPGLDAERADVPRQDVRAGGPPPSRPRPAADPVGRRRLRVPPAGPARPGRLAGGRRPLRSAHRAAGRAGAEL